MEPILCPEKAVINYHHSLRNNPEDSSSHLLCGGSLKSCLNELLKSFITHKISTKIISVKNQNSLHIYIQTTQNDKKQTIYRTTQKFWKSAGRAHLWVIPWHLPYN
jgi:hypothetical protein